MFVDWLKNLWARILCMLFGSFFSRIVLMFVDWFKNVSAMFVYVYEIYATITPLPDEYLLNIKKKIKIKIIYMCNSCLLLKESHEPGGRRIVLPDLVCGWGVLVGALSVAEGVCVGVVSGV